VWGWRSKHIPSNPSQPYYTVVAVRGFRVEENGKFTLYEFRSPMSIDKFSEMCRHVKSEVSLCPVSYFVCSEEIMRYVRKER
jgi:hypothetical protein